VFVPEKSTLRDYFTINLPTWKKCANALAAFSCFNLAFPFHLLDNKKPPMAFLTLPEFSITRY